MIYNYDFGNYINDINSNSGFSLGQLLNEDLKTFQVLVTDQYEEVMSRRKMNSPEILQISEYHKSEVANSELHKLFWPKKKSYSI